MNALNSRKAAIAEIAMTAPRATGVDYTREPISETFGRYVFSERVMRERLPKSVFKSYQQTMRERKPLDLSMADAIANTMKDWALENGATHYTHWFQPMTGKTAEKHDAFITPTPDGHVISEFSGKMLIKGEPDASSFPSGGIRATFEARGYTAWDPTSPAFILDNPNGKTLCIPTAFCSYTGEALDRKTPLLRSIEAVSKQALRILRLFGNQKAVYVDTTVGPEQEYFLIDKRFYLQRPDLINAGRTLYGSKPPKGQELEDHYFGSIRPRVLAFMCDCEKKLYELGIPVKTRHNEVSPAQFEIAPVFEAANVATDHNMLLMEVLRATAEDHGLVCLLHEKPFVGVNGSGKHNNWSLSDSEGNNLLEPGDTPEENAQFLVFLAGVLRAVHLHADALRVGVAGAGNDHRLGANEAPPAILSVYLGEQLTAVVDGIMEGKKKGKRGGEFLEVGVTTIPPLPMDVSDRNRTSPFAFTGNKFEFRAVGSSQSMAPSNIAINAAVASALDEIATELEKAAVKKGVGLNKAIQSLLQKLFAEHKPIIFNGDNYSPEWPIEADKRGLPNLKNSVDALKRFTNPKVAGIFTKNGILSKREVEARQEILLESYATSISIEAQLTANIGRTMILSASVAYQKSVADSLNSLRAALGKDVDVSSQKKTLEELTRNISALTRNLAALDDVRTKVDEARCSALEKAKRYRDSVLPLMEECRAAGDNLERYVDDAIWPLPKYREMLWIY
jgi:glutamine synthetase